jgi:hypothetical protein
VEVRRAEQPAASHADPAVDRIEEGATFVAPGELRGRMEESHADQLPVEV